ncbi:MAG: hypothetical protein PCFJNLEI_03067 [Verrucomicrobiae bacterium]|nr:hypothetical protein [Verrucomicrobiae bacterium]
MSDEIDLTPPPVPPLTALNDLSAAALARLSLGFYFLFWGLLVMVAALTESLTIVALRPLSIILIGTGGLAMTTGAWRLTRVTGLGSSWRNRTWSLFIVTILVAYLSIFFVMWRRLPTNAYLLGHALAFFAGVLVTLCLLCLPVMVLARAADRPGLALQAGAFGTAALVLLLPPFGLIVQRMIEASRNGVDPFTLLQFWVANTSIWITMILLVPFSLTLSLLWAAKDLVLEHLNARRD